MSQIVICSGTVPSGIRVVAGEASSGGRMPQR